MKVSPESACCDISQLEHGEWPDECPWAHVQEVWGEMMTLLGFTVHEVYCQSFKQGGLQAESGGGLEALMSHEQVVERLQEEACSVAIMASVMLTDAAVTYRTLVGNDQDFLIRSPMVRSCSHWLFLLFLRA